MNLRTKMHNYRGKLVEKFKKRNDHNQLLMSKEKFTLKDDC